MYIRTNFKQNRQETRIVQSDYHDTKHITARKHQVQLFGSQCQNLDIKGASSIIITKSNLIYSFRICMYKCTYIYI